MKNCRGKMMKLERESLCFGEELQIGAHSREKKTARAMRFGDNDPQN